MELRAAIERESDTVDTKALARAAQELSASYRDAAGRVPAFRSDAHRVAYLNVRMPATYAACARVFAELRARAPERPIRSLLDLGAGPGTALWAAAGSFPELTEAVLWERDAALANLGARLARDGVSPVFAAARWQGNDIRELSMESQLDGVVLAYVVNELPKDQASAVVEKAWRAAKEFLVIIEPGTPRGFRNMLGARDRLAAAGAHIAAPCPHERACPVASRPGDWCHFSVRLERTAMHRRLKQAEAGYEDEKFSYVIASRAPVTERPARILRHPGRHGGHFQLELCTAKGLERRIVSRSQKELYRLARRAEWGDGFPE